ncbi:hypothetical protein WN51_09513 [Melipona quadrifasciata]|uniref:Uncharacterized protein n=1 Tax=Melipona quadrifasciata TaxID=166423 RepID=A0A0N0BIS1_9HYME|nr:hypothetical protein WN51_09513 [Melipona quadrifasciata]
MATYNNSFLRKREDNNLYVALVYSSLMSKEKFPGDLRRRLEILNLCSGVLRDPRRRSTQHDASRPCESQYLPVRGKSRGGIPPQDPGHNRVKTHIMLSLRQNQVNGSRPVKIAGSLIDLRRISFEKLYISVCKQNSSSSSRSHRKMKFVMQQSNSSGNSASCIAREKFWSTE